ncbi:MAG: SMP-30/gluconolactonase/LRE family protein [Gemmatimonadota bacterium]
MRYATLSLVAATALLAACGGEPQAEPEGEMPEAGTEASAPMPDLPDTIVAERGGIVPEGIEYDPVQGRLLSGSLAEGSVLRWHPDGTLEEVVTDPDLVSSVGIQVDTAGGRLLVTNSDQAAFQGGQGQAMLGAYDLDTGERQAMVDLAALDTEAGSDASFFANDVAVGSDGAAYVTETMQNVLYRVDPEYEASVFHRFEPQEGLGLNGIVHHPDGYLLVAGGETLFKVPLDDPSGLTEVELPEEITGQDGMVWGPDGRLVIVSNNQNRAVALESADDWATAQLAGVASSDIQITTAAVVGDEVYAVNPHFADEEPPSVFRVEFQ